MSDLLALLNFLLTPFSIIGGITVFMYAVKSYLKLEKPKNRPVSLVLIFMGALFSGFAITSSLGYLLPRNSIGIDQVRSLIVNVLIIISSKLMIKIYRDQI